ncbi:MAG TPA: hypothetical protein VIM57_06250, partial [Luteolibacter sp.]
MRSNSRAVDFTIESKKLGLADLEEVIAADLLAFIRVGHALAEIQRRRLYVEAGFANFETYCRQRWAIGRQHGYRLITAAQIAGSLSPSGDMLMSESQLR